MSVLIKVIKQKVECSYPGCGLALCQSLWISISVPIFTRENVILLSRLYMHELVRVGLHASATGELLDCDVGLMAVGTFSLSKAAKPYTKQF